jgi:hypothetical protein
MSKPKPAEKEVNVPLVAKDKMRRIRRLKRRGEQR